MNFQQIGEDIAQIRKRGQVTIPAKFRQLFSWLNQKSFVKVTAINDGLLIKPLRAIDLVDNKEQRLREAEKEADRLLKKFAQLAKHDQNPDVNLTEFIRKDRQRH